MRRDEAVVRMFSLKMNNDKLSQYYKERPRFYEHHKEPMKVEIRTLDFMNASIILEDLKVKMLTFTKYRILSYFKEISF